MIFLGKLVGKYTNPMDAMAIGVRICFGDGSHPRILLGIYGRLIYFTHRFHKNSTKCRKIYDTTWILFGVCSSKEKNPHSAQKRERYFASLSDFSRKKMML